MFKVTPNPPVTDPASPYESPDSKKLHEAAERALDHNLGPPTAEIMAAPYKPNKLYMTDPEADTESLLVDASEPSARPPSCCITTQRWLRARTAKPCKASLKW